MSGARSRAMHPNAALLHKLFTALRERDHATMAACYHPRARFRDIAFSLRRRFWIHAMWRMICRDEVAIRVAEFEILAADDRAGRARILETYLYHSPGKPPKLVRNAIRSRFRFAGGRIISHDDDCDAKPWAAQAIGGRVGGFLAGRIRLLRSAVALVKLVSFVRHERLSAAG